MSLSMCQEDENAFAVLELTNENHALRREITQLKKEIRDWKMRLSLATDYNQCEIDLLNRDGARNVCAKCQVTYHYDYCYDRTNYGDDPVCDVCDVGVDKNL